MRGNLPQRVKNDKQPLLPTTHRTNTLHSLGNSLQNALTNEEIRPHHATKQTQTPRSPIIHHQQATYSRRRHPQLYRVILVAELQIDRSYHAKYEDAWLERARHQEVALRAGQGRQDAVARLNAQFPALEEDRSQPLLHLSIHLKHQDRKSIIPKQELHHVPQGHRPTR